jgi:hypothetical protein
MSKIKSLSSTKSKETIYIDVDDEITNIIEKVRSSKADIVALVLPKRAATLQSLVNMKLLKKSAEQADKNLVLVTTEKNLLPLAGVAGLHVAETAMSRPNIPTAPVIDDQIEDVVETADANDDFNPALVGATSVGVLAGMSARSDADEEIEVPADIDEAAAGADEVSDKKAKRDKKLAVPSFDSFKKKLALGIIVGIALIGFFVWALLFAPSATIKLNTETSTVKIDESITLSTEAEELDLEQNIVPATAQAQPKTYTQQASATGQQNNGEKATGSVTFTASDCTLPANTPDSISAGSSVTSNGKTYITQERAIFIQVGTTDCVNYRTNAVAITALRGGADYNLSSGSTFTGAGNGTGSASGGTDDIIKVVTQSDIDGAKAKIAAQDSSAIKLSLEQALTAKNLKPLPTTFLVGEPQVTSSAQPGDKADTVTVTATVNYNMLGAEETDLRKIVEAIVIEEIDADKQKILDNGLAKATFTQESPASTTSAVIQMKVVAVAGPEIDVNEIKQIAKGKKSNEIEQELKQIPGVTDVKVEYSPFWVSSVPNDENKISVSINETK